MTLNKPSGNMYPWAYTWNPLAGECPHKCVGCYVGGKIAPWLSRMGNDKYVGEPRLVEEEFKTKLVVPDGYVVFVQSCGDLFAYEIDKTWIWQVLNYISKFPQTTFLLQTKNPERFFDFNIPQNCILGTTIETNRDYGLTKAPTPKERYHVFFMLNNNRDIEGRKIYRLMVSIEPVMDFDLDTLVFWMQEIDPEFVSIGADSGGNNLSEPSPAKLKELLECLGKFTEVRRKKNLKRLLGAESHQT
jgi:DNA repair photolyase